MIRGTTPRLEFTLPFDFDVDQLSEAYVTLSQNGEIVVDKALDECEAGDKTIAVKLTQEETLKLKSGYKTEIQIKAKLVSGDAVASDIIWQDVDRIIKDGVI